MTGSMFQNAAPRLRVRDVRRAAEWYRDQLGFEIGEYFLSENETPGFVILHRNSVRIQLTLTPAGEMPDNPERTRNPGGVYFYVDDIDAIYDDLRKKKVSFLYELETFAYGMREFALLDIDGHYLGFGQPVS